jgi:hypothetical protein
MTAATIKTPMAVVQYQDKVLGFVLNRGRGGFEAFDIDEQSRGTFADERAAVAALFDHRSVGAP